MRDSVCGRVSIKDDSQWFASVLFKSNYFNSHLLVFLNDSLFSVQSYEEKKNQKKGKTEERKQINCTYNWENFDRKHMILIKETFYILTFFLEKVCGLRFLHCIYRIKLLLIITVLVIPARRSDGVLINNKKKRTWYLVDFAIPLDNRVKIKESKKKYKYLDLARELKKLGNMKMMVSNQ